jgi:hypothetical protein
LERRLDRCRIDVGPGGNPLCLVCSLWEIGAGDFDGLCLSCRAAVAHGLYRVHWLCSESGDRYRCVEFVTCAEHPLGTEYPNHSDPILYTPEKLVGFWRERDRLEKEECRAETVLNALTRTG